MSIYKRVSLIVALIFFAFVGSLISGCTGSKCSKIEFCDHLDVLEKADKSLIKFDCGIGSGAFHLESDPDDVIYTITDRGPNIKTKDAKKILGIDMKGKKGKIFPTDNFSPTIYKIKVKKNGYEILEKIMVKNRSGVPVSGISNPDTEKAWNVNGSPLEYDPEGIDAEGIVKLSDGTYFIGEEYGPSILHLAQDGRILKRWVPIGTAATLNGADYEIIENIPAIARKRKLNRGIESVAVSPDEKYLYFSIQSPLANPDAGTFKKSRSVRIFKAEIASEKIVGEYIYQMDTPDTFIIDNKIKKRKQSNVKISEMTGVGIDKLIVLERISKTTKFYLVDLKEENNILGSRWDNPFEQPSLEMIAPESLEDNNIKIVEKRLSANTDDYEGFPSKIEGLAWIGKDKWFLVNDNDFGIDGKKTYIIEARIPVE